MSTGIESLNKEASASATLPAAKLHVLQLEPIKARVGDRWPRMSLLVHSLFEKALNHTKGPSDSFVRVGELSYVVTFHDRSPEEAAVACAAIAQEVCEHLFGEGVEAVSVRSLVGEVVDDQVGLKHKAAAVADFLEETGKEKIVSKNSAGLTVEQTATGAQAKAPGHAVIEAHRFLEQIGRKLCFFPFWDLKKHTSSALILSPVTLGKNEDEPHAVSGSAVAAHAGEDFLFNLELRLLRGAGEYAQRVHASQKVCAVGVGVSYGTLSSFSARVRYITALKEIRTSPACPLLLKIEDIPQGVNLGRLGEIMNMVSAPHVRLMLEFSERIPELDFRMGAAGIGAMLPDDCPGSKAEVILKSIPNRLLGQQAFGFVSGLNSSALAGLAESSSLRFGMGAALDNHHQYTGLEAVPDLPLRNTAVAARQADATIAAVQ